MENGSNSKIDISEPQDLKKSCQPCRNEVPDMKETTIFPEIVPFPKEGILGMYPIFSVCKREVADHIAQFQLKLEAEMCETRVEARVTYPDASALEESINRVTCEMRELESEIDDLKHKLAVELIKKKYEKHESYCPCADDA